MVNKNARVDALDYSNTSAGYMPQFFRLAMGGIIAQVLGEDTQT